jgi:hypothetical protein
MFTMGYFHAWKKSILLINTWFVMLASWDML